MKTDVKQGQATVEAGSAQRPGSFKNELQAVAPRVAVAVTGPRVLKVPRDLPPVGPVVPPVAPLLASMVLQTRALSHAGAEKQANVARSLGVAVTTSMNMARAHGATTEQQQRTARTSMVDETAQQMNQRAVELIANELVQAVQGGERSKVANDQGRSDVSRAPEVARLDAACAPTAPETPVSNELGVDVEKKAAQAVALIEKIEVFVKKTRRPALALTLNNSLGAHVEIERIGPREVALKLVGQHGPPSPEAVSRIREEMQARGLRVAALSIA